MQGEGSEDSPADEGHGLVRVHEPVLLQESLDALDLEPGMIVVDGTVGAGGHAAAIAAAIRPSGVLIGLDRDAEILPLADAALRRSAGAASGPELRLCHASFAEIEEVLDAQGARTCDRIFLDLGVSSLQLDSPQRGFSFMQDGPVDMRMDRDCADSAEDWLRSVSERELARVLYEYGEERYSRRIARAIVAARRQQPIRRTLQLADLVSSAVPAAARRRRIHPATRTFQAIRIAVNGELDELARGLDAGLRRLAPGGRFVVIAFHSLEDRLVKRFVREHMELPFRKPIRPGGDECARNPRARSARLRCGIRRAS